MLLEEIRNDWAEIKRAVTYTPQNFTAVVRLAKNTLGWLPLYKNSASEEYFVTWENQLVPLKAFRFERFEPIKKFFDTATFDVIVPLEIPESLSLPQSEQPPQ